MELCVPPVLLATATEAHPRSALALPPLLQALTPESADRMLTLLLTLPHGVLKYSHTVPGEVGRLPSAAASHCPVAAVGPGCTGT